MASTLTSCTAGKGERKDDDSARLFQFPRLRGCCCCSLSACCVCVQRTREHGRVYMSRKVQEIKREDSIYNLVCSGRFKPSGVTLDASLVFGYIYRRGDGPLTWRSPVFSYALSCGYYIRRFKKDSFRFGLKTRYRMQPDKYEDLFLIVKPFGCINITKESDRASTMSSFYFF